MAETRTVAIPNDRVVTDADQLRWGIVSTVRAPLNDIVRFVAYHLDLGATHIHLYLDDPEPQTVIALRNQSAVMVTRCDDAYWSGKPPKARSTHQMRQVHNATRSYRRSRVDWLAHIDVDEFLLSPRPLAEQLAQVPKDAAFARLRSAEMLACPDPWNGVAHFKLTRREPGHKRQVLDQIYPGIGSYMPGGFLSHTGGKVFARTGLPDMRLGIHSLLQKGAKVDNGHTMSGAHVGHAHAPTWDVFSRHFDYRMTKGSYRRKRSGKIELQDVFRMALEDGGTDALRELYNQFCVATPELLQRLNSFDMLLTTQLDIDEKVARWFSNVSLGSADEHG